MEEREEHEKRCKDVHAFVSESEAVVKMLRYRGFMRKFVDARIPVLERSGLEWEVEQFNAVRTTGQRAYRICESFNGDNLHQALHEFSSIGPSLPHVGDSKTFKIIARAGAAMWEMCLKEQQTYPTKRFTLLSSNPNQAADDILEDWANMPHIFDRGTAAHLGKHPDAKALTSKESLAKLESQALILHDTTLPVEHGHGSSRRCQKAREQTHTEEVARTSAMRAFHQIRTQQDLSWIAQVGNLHADNGAPDRSQRPPRMVWRKKRGAHDDGETHEWTGKKKEEDIHLERMDAEDPRFWRFCKLSRSDVLP